MQVVGSIRACYSAIPVDVVVLCEFPLSPCVCYSEDHDQIITNSKIPALHEVQARYVWVRASEVIWSEYTRISMCII